MSVKEIYNELGRALANRSIERSRMAFRKLGAELKLDNVVMSEVDAPRPTLPVEEPARDPDNGAPVAAGEPMVEEPTPKKKSSKKKAD